MDSFNLGNLYGTPKKKRQPVAKSQKVAVKIAQKGRCKDCRKVLTITEYHHKKHVAKGGKSTTKNLDALCPECHKKRHINEKANKMDKRRTTKRRASPFELPKFEF